MKQSLKYLLLLLLYFGTMGRGFAQKQGQEMIDSLLQVLPKEKDDTNKVKLLCALSFYYFRSNNDQGMKYGQQGLDLAEKIGWEKGIAKANRMLGVNCRSKSNYPLALTYDMKALKISEKLGNKTELSAVLVNIGVVYSCLGNYPEAVEYYNKSLKIHEEQNSKDGMALDLNNIGEVCFKQGDYEQSMEYFLKALKIEQDLKNNNHIAIDLEDIGLVYCSQQAYDSALEYEYKALKIFEELGDNLYIASTLGDIGKCYLNIAKSNEKYDKNVNRKNVKLNLQNAIIYFNRAVKLSKDTKALDVLQEYAQYLSEAQELEGNYKEALGSYKQYVRTKDSVFSKENGEKIVKIGMNIEYEKKTAEAEKAAALKLQRQKNFTYSGIAGILLLAGFSFFIVKERRKSEKLLLNILPSEVAAELKAKGSTEAKSFDDVTVLFTDFKDFTNISEKLSAKELVAQIDYCFKGFDSIMGKYNIEKIKTIGDSYMAAGGLPVKNKTHAADVVHAALEIRDFMEAHKQKRIAEGKEVFEIRIGIHTGPVVAGIVGVKKFAYDIWGDTVNTASRMESSGEAGKVNISAATYELVKDKFTCAYRGKVEAKKKGMIDMYFVSR